MANNKVGGIAYLKINGVQYKLRGNAEYSPTNRERESVAGQDGEIHGYIEKTMAPYINMDLTDQGGLSLQAIQDLTDTTITLQLNNGKTFQLTDAWCVPQMKNQTSDGTIGDVRFEGRFGKEILSV